MDTCRQVRYASRYLNIIPLGDEQTTLLFNGVNGCLDEVPRQLGAILETGDLEQIAAIPEANQDLLFARGHLTSLPPEEEVRRFRDFVEALHVQRQACKNAHGGIMLLLSYNCNLNCPYCFQQEYRKKQTHSVMTVEMVDALFNKYLEKLLPKIPLREITFYGGEPFLPPHEPAIRAALKHAKDRRLFVKVITNATTAIDRHIDMFGSGHGFINWVQISLDGTREQHDQSRIPSSGRPTFDRILLNIHRLIATGTQISIRLNLDKKKAASLPALLSELKYQGIAGHPQVSIYASPLHDNVGVADTTEFLSTAELIKDVLQQGIDIEHPVSLHANTFGYLFALKQGQGLQRTTFCMQQSQRNPVVDPLGDIYACYEEAGAPELRVGRLLNDEVEFFPLRETYMSRHLANLPGCLKCPVALACGGQCGSMCRAHAGDIFSNYCNGMKELILEAIKLACEKHKAQFSTVCTDQPIAHAD